MALYCDKERKYNFCQKKMKTRMDRGSDEEWKILTNPIYMSQISLMVIAIMFP